MATLKIKQVRSRIGATAKQCRNLDALGLHKIDQTVTHSDSVIIKGMIERVNHLVEVEVVPEKPAKKSAPKSAKAKSAAPAAPAAEPAAEAVKEAENSETTTNKEE